MVITQASAIPYTRTFRHALRTSTGRYTHRLGWWLRLVASDGAEGWGDAAPFPGFGSSTDAVSAALRAITDPATGATALLSPIDPSWPPEVRYAVELACLSIGARRTGRPLASLLDPQAPRALPDQVASHHLAGAGPLPVGAVVKVKVGAGTLAEDEARVGAVRLAVGPTGRIRLDANRAWSTDAAARALAALRRWDIEWVEEPLATPDWRALSWLRKEVGVRVAADESLRCAGDLTAAIEAEALDAVVLKPMFLGGLSTALDLGERARSAGLEVIVTHALESAVGRAGAIAVAACLPQQVHGLRPPGFLEETPAGDGQAHHQPVISIGVPLRQPEPPPSQGRNAEDHRARTCREAIPHPLRSFALARPRHVALRLADNGARWTARELADAAARRANRLSERGVRVGQIVALKPPAQDGLPAWIETFWALSWLGASVAPLPPEALDSPDDAATRALCPDHVIDPAAISSGGTPSDERWWPLDEVRLRLLTSGTTGAPRRIDITVRQLLYSAFGSAIRLGHRTDDRWLCCLPLHHVAGLSVHLRGALNQITTLWLPRFDAAEVARHLDAGATNLVSLVPAQLDRVLDARADRPFPPSLRAILLGGGPASDALLARCRRIGAPVAITWGMTETASQIATRFPGDLTPGRGVGPPLSFARVSSDAGERLLVRGPLTASGELLTGDRGRVSEDGPIEVWGRVDRVLISGGEHVDPAEVEAVLASHPEVAEASVLAIRHPEWGERPLGVVVAQDPASPPNVDELRRYCRARLARFKVPDRWLWVPDLPKSALGKVRIDALRSRLGIPEPEHQREPNGGPAHPGIEVSEQLDQQLLEGRLAVLVDTPEEQDTGAVDFVASRPDWMHERHGDDGP